MYSFAVLLIHIQTAHHNHHKTRDEQTNVDSKMRSFEQATQQPRGDQDDAQMPGFIEQLARVKHHITSITVLVTNKLSASVTHSLSDFIMLLRIRMPQATHRAASSAGFFRETVVSFFEMNFRQFYLIRKNSAHCVENWDRATTA